MQKVGDVVGIDVNATEATVQQKKALMDLRLSAQHLRQQPLKQQRLLTRTHLLVSQSLSNQVRQQHQLKKQMNMSQQRLKRSIKRLLLRLLKRLMW